MALRIAIAPRTHPGERQLQADLETWLAVANLIRKQNTASNRDITRMIRDRVANHPDPSKPLVISVGETAYRVITQAAGIAG